MRSSEFTAVIIVQAPNSFVGKKPRNLPSERQQQTSDK